MTTATGNHCLAPVQTCQTDPTPLQKDNNEVTQMYLSQNLNSNVKLCSVTSRSGQQVLLSNLQLPPLYINHTQPQLEMPLVQCLYIIILRKKTYSYLICTGHIFIQFRKLTLNFLCLFPRALPYISNIPNIQLG